MENIQHRFFIALLPPQEIQEHITSIKQYFAEKYASSGALKSPPHITLQPPFRWLAEDIGKLEECLKEFAIARHPVPITLSGFDAFPPRVIYVKPIKSPELLDIQKDLTGHLETSLGIVDLVSKERSYTPHLTVAFQDLTKQNFKAAWPEFKKRLLYFEFTAYQLILLIHDGDRWNISREFPFSPII